MDKNKEILTNRKLDFVFTEYKKTKESVLSCSDKRQTINRLKYLAFLQWYVPFNKKYVDEFIENKIIEFQLLSSPLQISIVNDCDIVLTSTLHDFGALHEQYIYTLFKYSKKLIIIALNKIDRIKSKNTLSFIKENKIIFIELDFRNELRKIKEVQKYFQLFKPARVWTHINPDDIVAILCLKNLNSAKKFFIVHNDHTFWVGKNFFDYFIEFREKGISLAVERRGISKDKILHIPFYPIISENKFEGFPFEREGKIVGVIAANLYKFNLDPDLKYFKVIKELLISNSNFVLLICGFGDDTIIKKFIKENSLENNMFLVGWRKDFSKVVQNADILFESYPLKGGLTPLFATYHKKPIVGIADHDTMSGSLEEFLNIADYKQPTNLEEFKNEAEKLINSAEYREELGNILANNRYNKTDFEKAINKIFEGDEESLIPTKINKLILNDEVYLSNYLNISETNIENILKYKFYLLNSCISFNERTKLFLNLIKYENSFYKKIRLFVKWLFKL